ncbi:MAG TPA: YhjD/YihY/BrkB family envelope integrity protein [Candidatus Binatia bacterium]|nr:YhjD/YihY/BrkB family envelope integrity protein [Candidatus Binatia bacterium]
MRTALEILSKIKNTLYKAATVAQARYYDDALSLQAMSLTYTTLLSLVPFLAVMFSVLTAFGVQNVIEPMLEQVLEPLGPEGGEITKRIVQFVRNIQVGILGAVGLAALFYTVVSLVATMEDALNQIWRRPRSRSWGQRFTTYTSVVLVGPVLVFTALALTASAQSYWIIERLFEIKVVSDLFTFLTRIMPVVLLWGTFTFLYKLIPFAHVRFTSALVGGAAAAILWQLAGSTFALFVTASGRYAAIYSSFAIVIVFLIWLYVGWLIFLIGGEIAYFHQHPYAFVREALHVGRGHRFQEWLALSALLEITRRHLSGRAPWAPAELSAFLGVSSLGNLIDDFVKMGILLKSAEPEGVALARPPETITVKEILDIVAAANGEEPKSSGAVGDVLSRRDQAVSKALEGTTLAALASENQPRALSSPRASSASTG